MIKKVICKNCKKSIIISTWANDRGELARKKGKVLELICKNCRETHKYNVNDVSASTNKLLNGFLFIVVLVLMAVIGYYLFNNFWGKSFYMVFVLPIAIVIPGMIFFTYMKSQNEKVRNFNRFRK